LYRKSKANKNSLFLLNMRLVAFSSLPAILDSTKIAPHQSCYTGCPEKNGTL